MRAAAATLSLALGGLLAVALVGRPDRAPARAATAAAADEPVSRAEFEALEREVERLRARLAAQALRPLGAAATASALERPAPEARPTPAQQEELAALRHADRVAAAVGRLAREAEDAPWAAATRAAMAKDFAAAGFGSAVRDLACAATLCRIVIDLRDPALREGLVERLADVRALQGTSAVYHHEGGEDRPQVTLFVAREGKALPERP